MSRRFTIRYGRTIGLVLRAVGAGRRWSYVEIDDDNVVVRMSWAFSSRIHRRSIVGSGRHDYVWWAYGVHGFRGRWIVNGSGHDIVTLKLDPPARARVVGIPIRLREVWVSLEDPDGFLGAIGRS